MQQHASRWIRLTPVAQKHVKDRQKEKRVYVSLLLRCSTTIAELTNRAPQRGTGSKASTSSLNSLASGIDGPCWRRAMSGPTIPEELEDNVDPGATGHRQEPAPWKVTLSFGLTLSNSP